jgi:hypothetical protein
MAHVLTGVPGVPGALRAGLFQITISILPLFLQTSPYFEAGEVWEVWGSMKFNGLSPNYSPAIRE